MKKIDSCWIQLLQNMVKEGWARILTPEEEEGYRSRYRNTEIEAIVHTTPFRLLKNNICDTLPILVDVRTPLSQRNCFLLYQLDPNTETLGYEFHPSSIYLLIRQRPKPNLGSNTTGYSITYTETTRLHVDEENTEQEEEDTEVLKCIHPLHRGPIDGQGSVVLHLLPSKVHQHLFSLADFEVKIVPLTPLGQATYLLRLIVGVD